MHKPLKIPIINLIDIWPKPEDPLIIQCTFPFGRTCLVVFSYGLWRTIFYVSDANKILFIIEDKKATRKQKRRLLVCENWGAHV